jgi:hypothetical protein
MRLLFWILRRLLRGHLAAYKRAVADELAPTLEGLESVLDVGYDDGTIAGLLMQRNADLRLEGVDVHSLRPCSIPRRTYDGTHLPTRTTASMPSSPSMCCTTNTPQLLAENTRVSRKLVVLQDRCSETHLAWWMNWVGDWMTIAPFGISCVFNFPSLGRWHRLLQTGWVHSDSRASKPKSRRRRHSEAHPIFVLSKRSFMLRNEALMMPKEGLALSD